MAYGKHTIRGVEIYTDKTDAELMSAAEQWAKAENLDDPDLEDIFSKHSKEVRDSFVRAAEKQYPEKILEAKPGESDVECKMRAKEVTKMRKVLIEETAKQLFAGKLIPTRNEDLMGKVVEGMKLTPEEEARVEYNSPEAVAARKEAARLAHEQARRQEWGGGGGGITEGADRLLKGED